MYAKKKERVALLVEPKFQLSILLYVNILMCILMGILFYGVSHLFHQLETHLHTIALAPDDSYLTLFNEQRRSLWALFAAGGALVFFLANVGALIVGHRIAGPIYRIRMQIKSLRTGNKNGQIQFRKTDFFKHLEQEWNDHFGKGY